MDKQPFISIPLDIPNVRVLQTEINAQRELVLTVESTLSSTTCRRCDRTITEFHSLDKPHMLRHYLLTWLKKQGVDDALIQPYSGHAQSPIAGDLFTAGDRRGLEGVQQRHPEVPV